MKKLAVFFPGIGYTLEKPLLYYSRKLAEQHGYEILTVPYENFPQKVRGDRGKMMESFRIALAKTEEVLKEVDFTPYEEILFVGKSIGTIVAAKLAQDRRELPIRLLLYTPLEETIELLGTADAKDTAETNSTAAQRALAFSGTNDPWVGGRESRIAKLCYEKKIRCISLEGGNHSLETGDLQRDLDYLKMVMQMSAKFMS